MKKIYKRRSLIFSIVLYFVLFFGSETNNALPIICIDTGPNAPKTPILTELLKSNINKELSLPKNLDNDALLNMESSLLDDLYESAFKIGGTKTTQIGATARDKDGNYYVTGGYTGTIEFGSSSSESSGGYDFYVAKYDPYGNNIWFRVAKGATGIPNELSIDGGVAIAVDQTGNCYVGGSFVKSMTFLDAAGDSLLGLSDGRDDSGINFEMFIAKYNSSGDLLWAQGGNSNYRGKDNLADIGLTSVSSIVIDNEGYPYIGGSYSGTNFLGETISPSGLGDFYVAGLYEDGDLDWVKLVSTTGNEGTMALSVDSLGYINAIGTIGSGNVSLPDTNAILHTNNSNEHETFIISFDVNGEWYFASFINGTAGVRGYDVASDAPGNIFVAGEYVSEIDFGDNSEIILSSESPVKDGFITKWDLNGNALWARSIGGPNSSTIARRVEADEDGSCIVVGTFQNEITIGKESENPVTMYANGDSDMFIAKYDSSGNFLWATKFNGTGSESLDLIESSNVSASTNPIQLSYNNKKLVVSGDFNNSISFGSINLEAGGESRNGFVATMDLSNITVDVKNELALPVSFNLSQNYPNPFNPSTIINYQIAKPGEVSLKIYDMLGKEITTLVNEVKSAGSYDVKFNASNLSSGIYLYTLKTDNYSQSKKMILVK